MNLLMLKNLHEMFRLKASSHVGHDPAGCLAGLPELRKPETMAPGQCGEVIGHEQESGGFNLEKSGDGKKGRGFHLDRHRTDTPVVLDLGGTLAEHGIGRPHAAIRNREAGIGAGFREAGG